MLDNSLPSDAIVLRPYLPMLLAVGVILGMTLAIAYFERWEFLGVVMVVVVLAVDDYFSRQARIEGGRLTFEHRGMGTSSLSIEMSRIHAVRFRAMSVEICDDHGTRVVMDIGWYSGRQLDRILTHVRRATAR